MHLIIYAVGNCPARLAQNDVGRSHTPVVHQRAHQRQRDKGRRVQFDGVVVGNGIVQVQFDGNLFAMPVVAVAAPMLLIEVSEQCPPCFACRLLSCQLHHSLAHHLIGQCLVVPTVFHPQSGVAVPCGHTRRMNPCHTSGMNATPLANWFVGTHKQPWLHTIIIAKEHTVAVHSHAEGLQRGGRPEVGIAP